jgi:hypothetical protein
MTLVLVCRTPWGRWTGVAGDVEAAYDMNIV